MAEECTQAFGRYLKTLRERRQLSLDNVRSLSQTFPDQINKGYLSRCENGHQRLSFSKVIPLSRIYEVPADVLVERMELDMELDRVGGPETEGKTFAELTKLARSSLTQGYLLNAYAFARDGIKRAPIDDVSPVFRDIDEQTVIGYMNCATMARALGRFRFALHEYVTVASTGKFGPKFYPVILERISSTSAALRDYSQAERYRELALMEAEASGDREYLGYIYGSCGQIALMQNQPQAALLCYQKAHNLYRQAGLEIECARTMNNMSQCFFDLKRHRASRRAAEAASNLAARLQQNRVQALSQIILGELDELSGNSTRAVERWKHAAGIARKTRDKQLRFKAEFVLFRHALKSGDSAVARAIQRRLLKAAPWISADTPELSEFRALMGSNEPPNINSVSRSQHR